MRTDGGNMFGVVPRVLWSRICPPDDQNRISMDTNCLLVRTPDSLGLIDAGYGDKAPEKIRRRSCMESGAPLLKNLNDVGISADDIDWVILTHLHFDHAGGTTRIDNSGNLLPVFRYARHFVQQFEWDDAVSGRAEFAGAYDPDDFVPLQDAGLLTLVKEEHEIVPGVTTRRTDGHTRGQQLVRLFSHGQTAVYVADLCPTAAHLRPMWTMAYDQFPLTTRRTKPEILGEIADQDHVVILPHDPGTKIARLQRHGPADFELLPPA